MHLPSTSNLSPRLGPSSRRRRSSRGMKPLPGCAILRGRLLTLQIPAQDRYAPSRVLVAKSSEETRWVQTRKGAKEKKGNFRRAKGHDLRNQNKCRPGGGAPRQDEERDRPHQRKEAPTRWFKPRRRCSRIRRTCHAAWSCRPRDRWQACRLPSDCRPHARSRTRSRP